MATELRCAALVALMLQGCAGTPAIMNAAQEKSLQSLQLFHSDGSPQFTLYLTCSEKHGSCGTPENSFYNWSRSRNIHLHVIEPDEGLSATDTTAAGVHEAARYRVMIELTPIIVPSLDESGGLHGNMREGYHPPRVGYNATIRVFEVATGKLLLEVQAHDEEDAKYKGDASPYVHAQMHALIQSLDPGYQES